MRRKSERTVKSSPVKKAEPTSRRTSRRTRKSPEKATTITEEDSENSSDQAASSSENEADDVAAAPPKRARRSSRTIEKSSSAEEVVKATGSRSRRRTTIKKDVDIREEEAEAEAEAAAAAAGEDEEERESQEEATVAADEQTTVDEPKQSAEEADEKSVTEPKPAATEIENVDSSTEVTGAGEVQQECDNSVEPDGNNEHQAAAVAAAAVTAAAEPLPETESKTDDIELVEQSTEIGSAIETKKIIAEQQPVVEQSTKSRRRTLKRIDKENIADDNVLSKAKIASDDSDLAKKSSTIEEVKSSESKSLAATDDNNSTETQPSSVAADNSELPNGRNSQSDAADTTAKDTTASETDSTTKISKKKPIVRKRKWLTNKMAAPKVQEITISTDSLKGLISDVKPVPLSDVQLDSSPEADDQEPDDVKVVSSTSIDYNRRSEEHVFDISDDVVASGGGGGGGVGSGGATINISTSRKISIVNESEGEQPLSPAKHTPCNILYITNLVRPFTVLQLKSLLQRTGKIVEDGFWIDKIKSKCFVKYETEE